MASCLIFLWLLLPLFSSCFFVSVASVTHLTDFNSSALYRKDEIDVYNGTLTISVTFQHSLCDYVHGFSWYKPLTFSYDLPRQCTLMGL